MTEAAALPSHCCFVCICHSILSPWWSRDRRRGSRRCQTPNTYLNGGRLSPPSKSLLALEFEITHKWDIFDWYPFKTWLDCLGCFIWLWGLALWQCIRTLNTEACEAERDRSREWYKSAGLPRKGGADHPCRCHSVRGGVIVKTDMEDWGPTHWS